MSLLRAGKPSYRDSFKTAVLFDGVLSTEWIALWDNLAGYLTSRGLAIESLWGSETDPRTNFEGTVAVGEIPYNIWSGQPFDGMTPVQAKAFALQARKFRCRYELLFDQWHNVVDAANVVEAGAGDGGEGGVVGG